MIVFDSTAPAQQVAYIGLGSNLGDRLQNIIDALVCLAQDPCIQVLAKSAFYESAPFATQGDPPADGPNYVNAAAKISTAYSPFDLMRILLDIEHIFSRTRSYKNAPRTLDLDLLCYEDVVLNTPELTLPHPRIIERNFVVQPLLCLEPNMVLAPWGALKTHAGVPLREVEHCTSCQKNSHNYDKL